MRPKKLQNSKECDKIMTNRGWLTCPHCRRKLIRLLPTTQAADLVVYCRDCKHESIVNISLEPAPMRPAP